MRAVGIHVFAGGFTMGVRKAAQVDAQLEIHGLGRETVESMGVNFVQTGRWEDWPKLECDMCYGNPRCTGFSGLSSGGDERAHGPWATCTQDIWDLSRYSTQVVRPRVIVWESVQQAYTVGHPLIRRLCDEVYFPSGYRVAHLFLNAATFGNAQRRKRYFFVAYRPDHKFNIEPPVLPRFATTVKDVIWRMRDRRVRPGDVKGGPLRDPDVHSRVKPVDAPCLPFMKQGQSKNRLPWDEDVKLQEACPAAYDKWKLRLSSLPFSLHCHRRLSWDGYCPTLHSGASNFVHPEHDRTLTVRELSALMGWPDNVWPRGEKAVGQIVKGIVPAVGTWLAEQVKLYLDDAWGNDDWTTSYDARLCAWVGTHHTDSPNEKVIDMTRYEPALRAPERNDVCEPLQV